MTRETPMLLETPLNMCIDVRVRGTSIVVLQRKDPAIGE